MIKGKKVGLASYETRLQEIEYINRYSNYTHEEQMILFDILNKLEETIDKIQEINSNPEMDTAQREEAFREIGKTFNELEAKYEKTREEFDKLHAQNSGKKR